MAPIVSRPLGAGSLLLHGGTFAAVNSVQMFILVKLNHQFGPFYEEETRVGGQKEHLPAESVG